MAPIDAVAAALEATAPQFEERRDFASKRQDLIDGHAELKERELIKLATLASAIKEALRDRGVPDQTASLAAEAGIAIFKSAFERWLDDAGKKDLAHHVRESLDEVRTVASGAASRRPRTPVGRNRRVPGAAGTRHRRR
jgi:uncharacterized Zn finger protein